MMAQSKIEWTNAVWNPITGCTKVSAGCKNCYAEQIAKRFWGKRKFSDIEDHSDRKIPNAKMIFVNSMSDLFHEQVPYTAIDSLMLRMKREPDKIFQVLTKRAKRMVEILDMPFIKLPDNVWLGVSVENQETANERIPLLLKTQAAIKWVSVEPMLYRVDLSSYLTRLSLLRNKTYNPIQWVVCGGESGHNARPIHPDWVRGLRDQCKDAGVPFFFKQWGSWQPINHRFDEKTKYKSVYTFPDGQQMLKVGKKKAGRLLDSKIYSEYPI